MDAQHPNPFAVQTPESIKASDVVNLFVEENTDFHKIPHPGHTFLNGARGSGKSMIFRYLEPDCQVIARSKPVWELPYFAIYASIKNTDLNLIELSRLENKHAHLIFNEHMMVLYVSVKVFSSLSKAGIADRDGALASSFRSFYVGDFRKLLKRAGWYEELPELPGSASLQEGFSTAMELLENIYLDTVSYLRQLAYKSDVVVYKGPLFGYLDFLLPLVKSIKRLPFMPGGPVFLLLDDADNLNLTQTMILNTWVSHRTGADISLKISTQLAYKTYRTVPGARIDCPHDYSEVNISDIYTSGQKTNYRRRVWNIVKKRLAIHGFGAEPEGIFPEDEQQEEAIRNIAEKLKADWEKEGKGFRASDDALRYARPTFIASLKGTSKSGSTYSYAGFGQLVHISSGVVRYFLEAASQMYGLEYGRGKADRVERISPGIQNEVVKQLASEFLYQEFDKMIKDEPEEILALDRPKKLRNLIVALGGLFHKILLSDASERRVFSIAFSDEPAKEILEALELGIRYGYFHRSTIGNKEGTGRTPLYILSRRLAPYFLLDPTGFAGYKFVTSNRIREAMHAPKTFLARLDSQGIDKHLEDNQLSLFGEG